MKYLTTTQEMDLKTKMDKLRSKSRKALLKRRITTTITPPTPRYDKVYFAGLMWLNTL